MKLTHKSPETHREAIHIRMDNFTLNRNTQMYIQEIFRSPLGVDWPSNRSVQTAHPDHPQGHTHCSFPGNRFLTAVCLANYVAWISHLMQLAIFLLPIIKCPILLNFAQN